MLVYLVFFLISNVSSYVDWPWYMHSQAGAWERAKKLNEDSLEKLFNDVNNTKERNRRILQAYEERYSQHRNARLLGLSQPTVHGIVKWMSEKRIVTIA